jgi:hypothetical protein
MIRIIKPSWCKLHAGSPSLIGPCGGKIAIDSTEVVTALCGCSWARPINPQSTTTLWTCKVVHIASGTNYDSKRWSFCWEIAGTIYYLFFLLEFLCNIWWTMNLVKISRAPWVIHENILLCDASRVHANMRSFTAVGHAAILWCSPTSGSVLHADGLLSSACRKSRTGYALPRCCILTIFAVLHLCRTSNR